MTPRSFSFVLLTLLVACAGPRQKLESPTPDEPTPEDDSFALVLNNRHWLDMNIFVQHDGQASRVALVTASSTRSVVLPTRLLGHSRLIRVIAEPIGGDASYTTDYLSVQPGQIVRLNLESRLAGSSYSVQ